jgi:short-subunit dehydrogenase
MSEIVVVTGAGAGLGRATAHAFAERGCRVALLARGADRLDKARRELPGTGHLAIPTDMADPEAVERAAERIERELGPIDIWVNCAMTTVFAPVHRMTASEYRRVTEVTYLGYVHGTLAALHRMRARDRGTIVQVGSALAYRAIPLQSAYCAAKFAIRGFTDALRSELLHDRSRIHLTMVQMPALDTPQFDWCRNKTGRRSQPVPPVYEPEVGAEAIVFAAYARRREVWVGFSAVKAILANKVAPGLLDRILAHRGYDGQITAERLPPGYRDNLFEPVPGDPGVHGRFGRIARRRSLQLWATRHRSLLAGLAGLGLGGLAAASLARLPRAGQAAVSRYPITAS